MAKTIAADDGSILYSPYNWLTAGGTAKTICAGAYFRLMFSGSVTALSALFDVSNMPTVASKIGFRVDGGPWQDCVVSASVALVLPSDNSWYKHTVEMVVIATTETANRWNSPQNTAVVFKGLQADADITALFVRPRTIYGLAFGDSITEGVRTLAATATSGKDVDRNDARLAWAYPLTDVLGAEIGVVGFGAVGIVGSGSGGVPKFASNLPYLFSGQARDFSSPRYPDFIIGNIGTNDGGNADADVVSNTTALANVLISAVPSSTRIFLFAGWKQIKAAEIQQGIAACSAPERIVYLDTTGWWATADASDATHPYGYVNLTDLAPRLGACLHDALTPKASSNFYYCDAAGNAVPITTTTD